MKSSLLEGAVQCHTFGNIAIKSSVILYVDSFSTDHVDY
jgi:hypothetical protein